MSSSRRRASVVVVESKRPSGIESVRALEVVNVVRGEGRLQKRAVRKACRNIIERRLAAELHNLCYSVCVTTFGISGLASQTRQVRAKALRIPKEKQLAT